jgi:hypothetical protein
MCGQGSDWGKKIKRVPLWQSSPLPPLFFSLLLGISVTILWSRCSDPRGFVLVFHPLRQYLLHSNFRIRSLGDLACINPTIITLPTMVEKVYLTYNDVSAAAVFAVLFLVLLSPWSPIHPHNYATW